MSSPKGPLPPNLVIGCGYLGRRVARRWLSAGTRVCALTRGNSTALSADGIEPVVGDVLDSNSLKHLPAAGTVLYAVGWDRVAGHRMRDVYVTGLRNFLSTLPDSSRFIYASSTGVYGQTDGELVDERSATEPREESGRVVLEAEHVLRERRPDAVVLRFAGMYGPARLLRQKPLAAALVGDAERWLNLIHIDDGANAVLQAESLARAGETYIIADDEAVTRRQFYTRLAELLEAPPARFEHKAEDRQPNRRVVNLKAKTALNWKLAYPTYREGLPEAVRETVGANGR